MNETMEFREQAQGSIRINASAQSVWAVLADFHHVDKWAERARRVERLGDIKSGLGAMRRVDVKGAGQIEETITHWDEEKMLGYEVSPIGPLDGSLSLWTIDPAGPDNCTLSLTLQYNMRFGVIGRILHSVIVRRRIVGRVAPILSALKHYVETGERLRDGG